MQKNGFIAMAVLLLGGVAVHRAPLLASEAAPVLVPKAPAYPVPGPGIEWLGRELKLTDAQKQQLVAIHQDLEKQAGDIRGNSLLSPVDKKQQIAALHEGLATRIKSILTSDQIAKFDQMGGLKAIIAHDEPTAVGGMRLQGPNGFESLNLTDAQKSAIEAIMAQDKQGFAAAEGDVTKLRALKQATWQRIMAVLTPEQRQKLAAAKGFQIERGPGGDLPMPDLSSLDLTPDQHERLMAILEQGAPRAHAIQEDNTLSEAQKRARLTALYQEFRPRFLTVLTPAQEQQLHALVVDRPRQVHTPAEGAEPGEK
jgi:Spy/CpxP family protein refolding chaperone